MISMFNGQRTIGRSSRIAVALVGAGVVLAACSGGANDSGTDSGSSTYETGLVNMQSEGGDPVTGGTLTYGVQLLTPTLDPLRATARGGQGGEALAAVYDVLMKYDTDSGEFAPQLA
ncbi:MAG: ABC transporter substrate-binding protein, partial [Rhodococcus sp. (in: high G+C Gram-positive bacteria)]